MSWGEGFRFHGRKFSMKGCVLTETFYGQFCPPSRNRRQTNYLETQFPVGQTVTFLGCLGYHLCLVILCDPICSLYPLPIDKLYHHHPFCTSTFALKSPSLLFPYTSGWKLQFCAVFLSLCQWILTGLCSHTLPAYLASAHRKVSRRKPGGFGSI